MMRSSSAGVCGFIRAEGSGAHEVGSRIDLDARFDQLRRSAGGDDTLDRFAPSLQFSPIIGMHEVTAHKPAPEGLLKIAAVSGGRKIWYIGDTVDDARSARAAGVPFIGIASPHSPRRAELVSVLEAEKAVAVLDDINQLESVIG